MNNTLPCLNMDADVSYETFLKRIMRKIKDTRFLDVDPEDKAHKYLCLEEPHVLNCLQVQMGNGLFAPYTERRLEDLSIGDMGLLLHKEFGDNFNGAFTILKPVELLHDISAKMWIKARVQYRFPQDTDRIANDFPQLYHELTQEEEYWREVEPMDEAPTPYRLGDMEMLIPCDCICGIWGIKKGIFQFTIRENGLAVDFGPTREYLVHASFGVSFVSFNGREYFAVYRAEGRKRCKKDVFAHFKFHKLMPLSKVLAGIDSHEALLKSLHYAYHFHTHRNDLVSMPIDEDTFNNIDMAGEVKLTDCGRTSTLFG